MNRWFYGSSWSKKNCVVFVLSAFQQTRYSFRKCREAAKTPVFLPPLPLAEAIFAERPDEALRRFGRKMIDIVFDPETVELHRIVVAECHRFPKLGQFFYESGPQVCIDVLAAYLARNQDHPRFRVADPVRTAEEFLELLRGYRHLRMLLKLGDGPQPAEIEARIEGAVRHVLQTSG